MSKNFTVRPQTFRDNSRVSGVLVLIIIPIVILIFALFFMAGQYQKREEAEDANLTLRTNMNKNQEDLQNRPTDLQDAFVKGALKQILSLVDLNFLMDDFWQYSVTVNGQPLTGDAITVAPGEVSVVLTETRKPSMIPFDILNLGSITKGDKGDSPDMHLVLKQDGKPVPFVKVTAEDTTLITYTVTLKSGQETSVMLSPVLGDKIGDKSTSVKITAR